MFCNREEIIKGIKWESKPKDSQEILESEHLQIAQFFYLTDSNHMEAQTMN